jgi:hypothetical protein
VTAHTVENEHKLMFRIDIVAILICGALFANIGFSPTLNDHFASLIKTRRNRQEIPA